MNLVPLFEEALEFQNYNGSVLSNGKVAVFYIGRTRLADIFNDIEGLSPAENPKVLDNLGMGPLYVNPAFDYEIIVYDAYDNEMFSIKKYLHSKGEHSTANVVVTPSENIAVSAWTQGDVQVYMPYLTGDVGKTYEGIDPIVVNNEYNRISANHIPLGVQDPLYFVEDSESACIIGCSAQTEIPSALSSKWNEASDAVIANSAQWAEGSEYKAGSYVDIEGHTINVTGLQPEGDYAYNSALSSKLDVTSLPQDLVHIGDLTAYQPAGDYQTAGNYLSATDSAKFYPNDNPSGFITGVDLTDYATTTQLNEKLDKTDSGNFYPMEGNPSGFIDELPSDLATTGFVADVSANITAIIPTGDSNTISYSAKPTDNPIYASGNDLNNVNSIQGKSNLAIVPNGVLQVPNVITAAHGFLQVPNAITATNSILTVEDVITATPNNILDVPGVITTNQVGLTANGLSANTAYGLTANGLTADAHIGFSANGISAGKSGPLFIEGQYESIYTNNATGFTFSSQNTAFGAAQLGIAQGNSVVQMYAPKFEARNISGAGFSIEASGAKGYNESGNVVWDTNNPQAKNIISYGDTKTAAGGLNGNIILTTMPSTNASNLTNSPYVIMDATQASYFAAYGPSAQTPTVRLAPDSITFAYPVGNSGRTTVGYNDIKQELSGSAWTLTGSIQKREIEYDAETSAITAIAGSAIGGGSTANPQIPVTGINGIKISESGDKVVFEVSADYAAAADLTGKQDSLTFGYKETAISSIDNSALYDNYANARITTLAGRISNLSSSKLDSAIYANDSGTFLTAVPDTYLQNTDLTITDGKVTEISGVPLSAGGGGELPEAVSAATDYVTANSANIDATVSNVSANSGAWGGSALPISAGPGIKFELVDNTLVASTQGPILDKITIAGTWNGHEVKQMLQSGIFETNVNSDVIPVNSAYSAASSKWIDPANSYIQYGSTSNILPSTWVLGATGRLGSLSLLNGIVRVRSNDTTNTQCTAFVTIKWCEN